MYKPVILLYLLLILSAVVLCNQYKHFFDHIFLSCEGEIERSRQSNGRITVVKHALPNNASLCAVNITACVLNSTGHSENAVETALDQITAEMINTIVDSVGILSVPEIVSKNLSEHDGYVDLLVQYFNTSHDVFTITLDTESRVVHRSWNIDTPSAKGTWHVFAYPAKAPTDMCLETVEPESTTKAPFISSGAAYILNNNVKCIYFICLVATVYCF